MKWTPISLVAVGLSAFLCAAQTANDPNSGKSDRNMTVPATQAGVGTSLALTDGRESSLSGGLGVTGMYTDNIFLSSSVQQSDFSYDIQPYLAWRQFTSRLSLEMSGGAGIIVNQRTSERNQAAENFSVDLTYRLQRYLTLRIDDSFVNTSGLFSGITANADQSGIGVVQQSNSTLITPASHTLTNSTLVELTDQFSSRSNVGGRGVVSILRYPGGAQSVANVPLYEGESYAVEAFYNHQLSERQWFGLTLRAQRFDSQSKLETTDAESALFFYSLQPIPTVNISFFGGPQLTVTSVVPALAGTIPSSDRRHWTPAAGATLDWQKAHTSAHLSYIRQASDGGGLSSAVTNETVQAGIRRQLSTRQQLTFAFTYAANETLVPGVKLRGYSGQGEFSRRLTGNFSAGVGYRFEQQGSAGDAQPARANRTWISFSYEFSRPLGK